jgi:lipid II:glycine glycyltransferase (peptidoglycan interpeptide bridge formation enzyme)
MMDAHITNFDQGRAVYRQIDFDENRVRWDRWLKDADHGDATQLSAHLNSFRAYRANVELHVVEDDRGDILAGAGMISWKIPGIGVPFGIAAGGPVGDTKYWPLLLEGLSASCRQQKWMCVELRPGVPIEDQQARDSLAEFGFQSVPQVFAPVSTLGFDLRVRLAGLSEDELVRSFRRQTRQHVQRSLAEGYQIEMPTVESDIRAGADFFYETTVENGLPFGPRSRFLAAVLDLVRSETGYLALVKHQDRPLAGGVFVRAGRAHRCYRLVTKRDETYRRPAYYLHWQAMLRARQENVDWYYLTGRSTASVHQFKRGFRPQELEFLSPHRLVLRPALMRSIETIQPLAKKTALGILGAANRWRARRSS